MTVCLCMIVKNEAAVIARCLASVRPLIDTWVIVDTGSTDGTQGLAAAALADLPGEVVERPWVDFAANRSEALALARDRADYALVIDADDWLEIAPGFALPPLKADAYDLDIRLGQVRYQRPQLFANRLPWRYRGVLHEFAEAEGAGPRETLPGVTMICGQDGARRHDPATYARDAAVLERALQTETDPFLVSRYTFYLAQSWRDAGDLESALGGYIARATMGFWEEEIYISFLNAGRILQRLGAPTAQIEKMFEGATVACPHRAEAIHALALHLRSLERYEDAYQVAAQGRHLTLPAAGLFIEPDVYRYALLDELGISAWWSGHHRESLAASLEILAEGRAPAEHRDRIVTNARFALDRLAA